MYLCVRRDLGSRKRPISDVVIILPERGEIPPPGYSIVQRRGVAANINTVRLIGALELTL